MVPSFFKSVSYIISWSIGEERLSFDVVPKQCFFNSLAGKCPIYMVFDGLIRDALVFNRKQ